MKKTESSQPAMRFIIYAVVFNLIVSIFSLVWNFVGIDSHRIVYVDAIKLLSKYRGMEDAKKELDQRSLNWQANLDTLKKEADKAISEFEASKNLGSVRERQLLEELAKAKQAHVFNYEQTVREQFQKQDQELSKKILEKVNDYIKRYGEEHGYSIVLAATHYGNIAYGNKDLDITEKVLEGLNAEYQRLN